MPSIFSKVILVFLYKCLDIINKSIPGQTNITYHSRTYQITATKVYSNTKRTSKIEFKQNLIPLKNQNWKKKNQKQDNSSKTGQFKQKIKEYDNSNRKLRRISMKLTKY